MWHEDVDGEYSTAEKREQYDSSIKRMEEECSRLISESATDLTKATIIHDFINSKITYAFQTDGVTPETPESCVWTHNITGVSYLGRGVCEAYAKTFLYLCNLNRVECILVNGVSGEEEHAWNYACFDDCWYLIDLTFDDTNDNDSFYLYLGVDSATAESKYQANDEKGVGVNYQYALPKLSDERLCIVDLYKDGEYLGVYKSPDDAFSSMSGAINEYELFLKHNSGMSGFYYSDVSQLPTVKSITLSAPDNWRDNSQGYFVNAIIFNNSLVLNSCLYLRNVNFTISSVLELNSYDLFLEGRNAYVGTAGDYIEKMINGKGSSIFSSSQCAAEIWSGLTVSDLYVGNTNLTIRGNSTIDNLYGGIRIYGGFSKPNISILNWFCEVGESMASSDMYIDEDASIEIGNIYGEDGKRFTITPTF